MRLPRPLPSQLHDAQPFTNRSRVSTARPRREAMTSRSSMSAQRRHPRHPDDSASASWSARCPAREPTTVFPPASMRARVGRSIMKIWLTVAEASLYSGARKERGYGDGC